MKVEAGTQEAEVASAGFFGILRARPNFFALWSAKSISRAGDRFTQVALATYALQLTGNSAAAMAAVLMSGCAPHFLFGWALGVLADRVDRKRAMVVCDIARGLLIASVPFVPSLAYLCVVAFLMDSFSALFMPCYMASVPETVTRRELLVANSLSQTTWSLVDILGATLATVVINAGGVGPAFWVDAASFVISAGAVLSIRARMAPESPLKPDVASFMRDFKEGVAYQFRNTVVRSLLVVACVSALLFGAINTLTPVAVGELLGLPPQTFGVLLSTQGVAMLVGAFFMGNFLTRRMPKSWLISLGVALVGLSVAVFSTARALWMGLACYFVLGVGNVMFLVPMLTWVQEATPLELRGRVLSIRDVLVKLAMFISGGAGALADAFGTALVLGIAGALTVAVGATVRLMPGLGRRAEST